MERARVAGTFSSCAGCELRVVDFPVGIDICQSATDALSWIWVLRFRIHHPDDRLPCARSSVLRRSLETDDRLWHHYFHDSPGGHVYHCQCAADSG